MMVMMSRMLFQFTIQLLSMIQLTFAVSAQIPEQQVIRVVGAIPSLGSWDPNKALRLEQKEGIWIGPTIEIKEGTKCEFKLIRGAEGGEAVWEDLPNNSNRKFKPKYNSKLHLTWSKPEGKVTQLNKGTYKVSGLPAAIIKPSKRAASPKRVKQFDPYENARDQDSDSSEGEFELVRHKMTDEILINSGDLQDIYYSANSVEVFAALLQKTKVYVISRECDLKKPLHSYMEKQLLNLPPSYVTRWITTDSFLKNAKSHFPQKKGSLFDVRAQELHFQSLYSLTSYFILLELETALELNHQSCRVPTCLLLPAQQLQDVQKVIGQLGHISMICYDDPNANREFYEFLRKHVGQKSVEKEHHQVITPSIGAIVDQLQRLRYDQPQTINTLCNISEEEALSQMTKENSMCIVDGEIIQKYPLFAVKLMNSLPPQTLLVIITQASLSQSLQALRQRKNVALIFENYEKLFLQDREYHPLRKFKETIELLRMKSKLYIENYGGDITQKESSFIYCMPQGREQWARKVQGECKAVMKQFSWVRVSRRGTKVKMTWSLSKKIRLLRTLCEVKYLNYGALGDFHLLVHGLSFKQIKEELSLLIEHKSKLFMEKHNTRLTHNSYDFLKPTVSNILPASDPPPPNTP